MTPYPKPPAPVSDIPIAIACVIAAAIIVAMFYLPYGFAVVPVEPIAPPLIWSGPSQ